MADDDEIILSELSDDELVLQMHDDLYDGLKEEIEEGVNILIARGWTPYDVLTKALVAGMTIVGADFRDGILFVPEVLLAANAMKAGMLSTVPISPSMASAASLAPPCAGPQRQAMPAAMQANGLAPDEPARRTVEVDAFCS